MANIATFLFQHDDTPNRVLYRQFIDNESGLISKAREMIEPCTFLAGFFRSTWAYSPATGSPFA